MKFATILAFVSVVGMVFGWWGLQTISGGKYFDEMAGMIPLIAGVTSAILLPIAVIIYYFAKR